MRVALVSALVAGAAIACSAFGTDEGASDSPAAAIDAGNDVASSSGGSSGASNTSSSSSSSGATGEAGAFACPSGVAFCDDFARSNPTNVKGAWTQLFEKAPDPPPTIENGAFHLFAAFLPDVPSKDDSTRTYLEYDLPNCTGARVAIDFDFMLEDPLRDSNLSVIAVVADGKEYYTSLGLTGSKIELATSVTNDNTYVPHGSVQAPAVETWTHAQLVFDVKNGIPSGTVGAASFAPALSAAPKSIVSCRFTIGNDFIAAGPITQRWYDNVTATVTPD